jgi:FRG domain
MKNPQLAELHERSARGFVDLLSPAAGILAGEPEPQDFIYRGYGSELYELVPSAFRGRRPPFPDNRPVRRRNNENQVWAEVEQLWEFYRLADSRGLAVPEDSQRLRRILADCRKHDFIDRVAKGKAAWPPDELLSVLALAQHYGIPTRLVKGFQSLDVDERGNNS